MKTKIAILSIFIFFIQFLNAYCLESSLYSRFSGRPVKIFIGDVKDSTKEHELDLAMIKSRIAAGLEGRKSVKFQVVPTVQEADISLDTQVTGYLWTDHDPIDMLVGIGATALDAAKIEDYAAMEADVTVTDVKSDKPIWKKHMFATVTKKPMSKAQSVPLVTDNFVKAFIKDCFSKRRK